MELRDCVVGLRLSLRFMSYGVTFACQLRRMMMSLFMAVIPISHALAVSVRSLALVRASLCRITQRDKKWFWKHVYCKITRHSSSAKI